MFLSCHAIVMSVLPSVYVCVRITFALANPFNAPPPPPQKKALWEQDDTEGFDKQGMRVLLATVSKIFDSLQTAYEGW